MTNAMHGPASSTANTVDDSLTSPSPCSNNNNNGRGNNWNNNNNRRPNHPFTVPQHSLLIVNEDHPKTLLG